MKQRSSFRLSPEAMHLLAALCAGQQDLHDRCGRTGDPGDGKAKDGFLLILENKLRTNKAQAAAIDEAIRTVQFIRNKCLRLWMDGRGIGDNDLQTYSARLAKEYPFAARLNSQARQTSADRAWLAIARFYKNCREHKPGKKGYPRFRAETIGVWNTNIRGGSWNRMASGSRSPMGTALGRCA